MAQLTKAEIELLNKFAETQPALNSPARPFPESALNLGSALGLASSGVAIKALYDVSIQGGTIGLHNLGVFIPAGAIVTAAQVEVLEVVVDADGAGSTGTWQLQLGQQDLMSPVVAETVFDVQGEIESLVITPKKASGTSQELYVEIADSDLTAGRLQLYVSYILPR